MPVAAIAMPEVVVGLLTGAAVALGIVLWLSRSGRGGLVEKDLAAHRDPIRPAETALDAARFKALVEGASDLIALVAADGTLLYSSPSIVAVLGYPPAYNLGEEIWHLIHPDDLADAWQALTGTVAGDDEPDGVEFRLRHADGTWRWMEARGTNRTDDPSVRGVVVVSRDITERKLFERRLEEGAARASQILDATSDAIIVLNESGQIVLFNKASQETFGYESDEVRGWPLSDLFAKRAAGEAGEAAKLEAALRPDASGAEIHLVQMARRTGEEFTAELTRSLGVLGKRWVNVLVVRDVTPRMEIQSALVEAERTLRSAFDASPTPAFIIDRSGAVGESNMAAQRLFGVEAAALDGASIADFIDPARRDELTRDIEDLFEKRVAGVFEELDLCRRDGARIPARLRIARLEGVVGSRGDRAVCQVEYSERRFELAFESAPVGMALVDFSEQRAFVNAALHHLLGEAVTGKGSVGVSELREGKLIDRRAFASLIGAASVEAFEVDLERIGSGEIDEFHFEESLVHSSGAEIPVLVSVSLVRDEGGDAHYLIAQVDDMTEQKEREWRLARAATQDALTGLANRALFVERLGQALARGERHGSGVAVLFCDMDNLKAVNDRFGHAAGDEVLAVLAYVISQAVRTEDLVARFGGDEFVVLCEDLSDVAEARDVACRIVDAVARGVDVPVGHLDAAITVGVAMAGGNERPGQVIRRADAAMYRGKRAGGNRCEMAPTWGALADESIEEAQYGSQPGIGRGVEFSG